MNLTANELLAMMRAALPTQLMADASDGEVKELLLTLYRWHVLASSEADLRVRQGQKESRHV